jgi:MFS family permease
MLRPLLGVGIGWVGISMVADGVPSLLLPHQLVGFGDGDATTLGLATLVAIGAAAAIQPVAGRTSDRFGRGPVLAAGTLLAVGGLVLLAVPVSAVIGAAVALVGVSVAQAAYQALLPDRIGIVWRGRGAGVKGAFDVAGATLGFVLIAAAIGAGAPQLAAFLLAGILVAGFGAGFLLLGRTPLSGDPERHAPPVRLNGTFAWILLSRFLFLLGIYVVGRFLLMFVADRVGLGPDAAAATAGSALGLLALVTVVASVPAGWLADRVGRRGVMVGGGCLAAGGILLLPTAMSLEAIIAFGILLSLGSAGFASASWAMLADVTAPRDAGRLLGFANLATAGAAALAGLFGIVIDLGGFEVAFGAAAACALAGGLVSWKLGDEREAARVPMGASDGARP